MGKIGVDEKGPIQVSHLQWDPRASHPHPCLCPSLSLQLLWKEKHLPLPPFWQSDELPARPGDGKCL